MRKKTSKTVKARSGSIATVVWLTDRRSLGTCVHGKQFGGADVLPFPLERLHQRGPCGRRNASALSPLLDGRSGFPDVCGHLGQGGPGSKNTIELRAHEAEYASDELSAQAPPMIPMTAEAVERTIRPTMGRSSTPVRFREEMAKRLEAARRVAGFATKKEAAARLGIGLDRYEKWESGRTPVPAQYVAPVCELYSVDANYLFGTQPKRAAQKAIA